MVSVFENNKDKRITIHILADNLSNSDKNNLSEISRRYEGEIVFYDINDELFKGFPTSAQWPRVIYYRLMLPNMVEHNVERILYVDCDIIFRGSIQELMEIELDGKTIAAVEDVFSNYLSYIYLLGYPSTDYYFNSGVILVDVKKWKTNNITRRCIDYIKKNKVIHPDQDALNAVLHNSWKRIPNKWNFLSNFHVNYINKIIYEMDINKTYPDYPVICHFTGLKPWDSRCRSPFKSEFFEYQDKTVWKNCIPSHSFKERVHECITRMLDRLGIRKYNQYYKYNI